MSTTHDNVNHLGKRRMPALDGLRGLLALVVFIHHVFLTFDSNAIGQCARVSVYGFFVLSGLVLTRAWDGRFGVFLARRFIRLWPVYALCLAAGYLFARLPPLWTEFFWYPIMSVNTLPKIDPPIWSLTVEAWAMLLMPLYVWASKGKGWRALACIVLAMAACALYAKFFYAVFFIIGAWLSRADIRNRFLESNGPQQLGRISYSFYLSHWIVLEIGRVELGPWGLLATIPASFGVGWLIWRFVEMPSIALSRRLDIYSKPARPRVPAPAAAE